MTMNLLFNQSPKLCFRKPVLVRSSPHLSNDMPSSLLQQTPPCAILYAESCGGDLGRLNIWNFNEHSLTYLKRKVPLDLVDRHSTLTVGSCNGWVATLMEDGILRLQDDLNPVASDDTDPKEIPLPPLVTLPHCQTQIITNVSMSSSSPEDEDCVVAVKFLGPQISFCRPAQSNCEWINIRIENPCFYSSRVMFSKKDEKFCMPGSGGHIIGSWDPQAPEHTPKIQKLRFKTFPQRNKNRRRKHLDSCCTSDHLVESRTTGEIFLIKWYKKTLDIVHGVAKMKTEDLEVYKVDDEGNAYCSNWNLGGLSIFLSKSEPFCVPVSSFPGLVPNQVYIFDVYELGSIEFGIPHTKSIHNGFSN